MSTESRGKYGWVIVAVGGLMGCMAVGAMFSLAVFLQPMQDTGWSRTAISSAMTLNFLLMGAAGFAWGLLSDRFGARIVVLAGSIILGAGLVLASRATSQLEFQLVYGVLVGISAGSFFAPMIAAVSAWFDRHRGLAISLVSAGVGIAPMTMSPLAAWLLTITDWRTAQMTLGILVWVTLIPASFLVRRAPAAPSTGTSNAQASEESGMTMSQAFRSPAFMVLSATFFACCAAHAGPIFHTVSYAIGCGLPTMAAVSIYSVEGLGGLVGRVAMGMLADRVGAKSTLIAGLVLQALGAGAFVLATRLHDFYMVAAVFGFAYGGTMPIYAVLARHYFGQRIMGGVLGAASMISALGMALGPALGGWIFDTYHTYTALYIGSLAVGLVAVVLAAALPRAPRAQAPAMA